MLETFEERLIAGIILATILVIVVGTYYTVTSEKFTLDKNKWACTETQVRNVLKTLLIGDKISNIPTTEAVCVEYKRR